MITLSNITKIFETETIQTKALDEISLTVNQQDFVAIMGASGCGKSTLLSIMGLLDTPTSGSIHFNGELIDFRNDSKLAWIRNRNLGFIFQSFNLIPSLNVIDNVKLPLLYRKECSDKEAIEKAETLIEKVGLQNRRYHYPSQMSGGQCQRVAIARALVGTPSLILADEPTGNLDSKTGGEIMELLTQLNQDGTTIVMVTHDSNIAAQVGKTYYMSDGKLQQ